MLEGSRTHSSLLAASEHSPGEGLVHSAALSQRRYLDEDYRGGEALFPVNRFDEDRQQVDLREMNSWRLRMHEVETPELLEVQLVNAIAPYILNARLKPLMVRTPGAHKHIVNVSAIEGQFYRATKTDKHAHTNMAKAALNMMTRTSAPDFVKDGIHMNAVDTGWITDEDPAVHAARKAEAGILTAAGHHRRRGADRGPDLCRATHRRACVGTVPEGLQAGAVVAPADQQVVDGREVVGAHALADAHVGNTHGAGHEALIDADAQHRGQARGPGAKQSTTGSAIVYSRALQQVAKVTRPGCDVEIADDDAGVRAFGKLATQRLELGVADARRGRHHRPVEMSAVETEFSITEVDVGTRRERRPSCVAGCGAVSGQRLRITTPQTSSFSAR